MDTRRKFSIALLMCSLVASTAYCAEGGFAADSFEDVKADLYDNQYVLHRALAYK